MSGTSFIDKAEYISLRKELFFLVKIIVQKGKSNSTQRYMSHHHQEDAERDGLSTKANENYFQARGRRRGHGELCGQMHCICFLLQRCQLWLKISVSGTSLSEFVFSVYVSLLHYSQSPQNLHIQVWVLVSGNGYVFLPSLVWKGGDLIAWLRSLWTTRCAFELRRQFSSMTYKQSPDIVYG